MSHTPGPWGAFSGTPKRGGGTEYFAQPLASRTEFGGIVAVIPQDTYAEQTQKANARLIAAAPDLLAALEGVMRAAALPDFDDYSWHAASLAIKKARGES